MSFTREQYVEVAKNAAALYTLVRDDMSGAHRHKMRGKALAVFIMDQCEQVIGQGAFERPDYRPDMKNGGMERVSKESLVELQDRFRR